MMKTRINFVFLILLALFLAPSFIELTKPGYFPMHDDIQGMRVLQMEKCILDLQIPCRWVPDMGYGFGYPQFNFYAPLPYYLMAIISLSGYSILSSVKLGFLLSILFSGISMYLLGKKLWGPVGGVVSSLFYTYAPYRAVDVYVRGAMGEAWAFVFLPLILLFTIETLEGKRRIALLALSMAALGLTHNVTIIMFAPFYIVFVLFYKKLTLASIKRIIISGLWGLSLSAFFLIPAYFEKDFVHVDTILAGYFNYLAHFVGVGQLLLSSFWGYGVSSLGDLDGMSLAVGLLHWTAPLLALLMALYLRKVDIAKKTFIFMSFGFIALFLIHPRSQIIWDNVEIISYVQFPWRFLSIAILFFSIAIGSLGSLVIKSKPIFLGAVFVIVIFFYGSFMRPFRYIDVTDAEKFSGDSWVQQQTISIFDYLPKSVAYPPTEQAFVVPYALNGNLEIIESKVGTNWQRWRIIMDDKGSVVFPIFDYPVFVSYIDGVKTKVDNSTDLGLVTVNVPKGDHEVLIILEDTPLRAVANYVSLIAMMALVVYPKFAKKYEK